MEIMNGYELLAPFQNKNAGFSRWTFATKNGKEYFLKEFIDPVFPTDESISLDLRKRSVLSCREFESKKTKLYLALNNVSDGHLVRINEFFRYDNHYYISTERITGEQLTINEIASLPFEDKLLLCKTIAHSVMQLHKANIVHADIKESNVIIKQTKDNKLVGKIIDFDASFFESEPPEDDDELGGDQVYLAPEACQFICGESVQLTCKIDVFSLGLLFHQYLTGELPSFDVDEYDYAFYAVLDDRTFGVSEDLDPKLNSMISGMLECDYEKRYNMEQVFSILDEIEPYNKKIIITPQDWFYVPSDL